MKCSLPHNVMRRSLFHSAVMLSAVVPYLPQTGGGSGGELQQKMAAVKESVAENQQKLHQYQWTETTQLKLKDEARHSLLKTATALVGTGNCFSTRAKWRALRSAQSSTLRRKSRLNPFGINEP